MTAGAPDDRVGQAGGPDPEVGVVGSDAAPGTAPDAGQEDGELFAVLTDESRDEAERDEAREELVRRYLTLVERCAYRYRFRGEPIDDLVQVGTIGLLNAVDRYDPDRGVPFGSYAVPTVLGEIRRHFRDRGWTIRVPRRVQEMHQRLGAATDELSQSLGRAPTPSELAVKLGVDVEEVVEGLGSANAYAPLSLDAAEPDGEGNPLEDRVGADDPGIGTVELRASLQPALAKLPDRERRIIELRFQRGLTQSQIAAEIGISQMHVSRLLTRTLATLRESLTDPDG